MFNTDLYFHKARQQKNSTSFKPAEIPNSDQIQIANSNSLCKYH